MTAFILRSKNRPGYASYEPESISAWGEQPDESMAPVEAWELVEDLAAAYAAAPECVPKQISSSDMGPQGLLFARRGPMSLEPQAAADPALSVGALSVGASPANPPEEEGV